MKKYLSLIAVAMVAIVVTACGGSGGGGSPSDNNDVIVPSSPVTINFPMSDGQNVLVPGDEVTFTVSLNGTQQVQSSNSKSLTSVTSAPVELALTNADSNAYSFSESSFTLTQSNPTKTVTLTILSSASPSQFGENTQLVANVSGYQTSAPILLQIVSAGTISFNANDVVMSTASTSTVMLKVAGKTGINAVVDLVAQDGITLSAAQCTFTPSSSTCPITITSSTASGEYQVTASSTNGSSIKPLTVIVQDPNSIKFGQSSVYLVASDAGTLNTTVVTLSGSALPLTTQVSLKVTPSKGLEMTSGGVQISGCELAAGSETCEITLEATTLESGDYAITATAAGYDIQDLYVHVNKPGTIHFEPNSLDMFAGESYQVQVVFNGTAASYDIPVKLSSNDANVTVDSGESDPAVCTISSAIVGNEKSCNFTVKAIGDTSAFISATEPAATHIDPMTVVVRKFVKTALLGSYATSCALDDKGQAYCWGQGTVGQIGNEDLRNVNVPTRVSQGDLVFSSLIGASQNFCALTTDGQAYCWGAGTSGQIGNGAYVNVSVPTAVEQGSIKFSSLYASSKGNTICGLTSSGQAYCWGDGATGQLGNDSTAKSATPSEVKQNGLVFTSLAMNSSTNCGLTNDGTAACWGLNKNGQVGNENTLCGGPVDDCIEQKPVAITMPANVTFKALSAMSLSFCALDTTGKTYCWGKGNSGQMGDSYTATSNKKPVAVIQNNGVLFTSLVSLSDTSCGLTSSGQTYCWGSGTSGVIGGGAESSTNPTPVAVLQNSTSYTKIFANQSANMVCANTVSGQIYCWGTGTYGQLGNGALQNSSSPVAVQQAVGLQFASLMANGTNTCGLTSVGNVYCWGLGTNGQIGNGISGMDYTASVPSAVVQPNATPALLSSAQLLQTYAHVN